MAADLSPSIEKSTGASKASTRQLLNLVEPEALVEIFLEHPPIGFSSFELEIQSTKTPVFLADFDLLTTLDHEAQAIKDFFARLPVLKRLHTFPTLFAGTTATEYTNYPGFQSYFDLAAAFQKAMRQCKAELMIVKDIPCSSPLLSPRENEEAEKLVTSCQEAGAIIVEGQALAYLAIDFDSIDAYMQRLSKSRRKEFRKKLKESANVRVSMLDCGSPEFFEQGFLDTFYSMYLNVYQQSEIHFDLLSRDYFRALLQNKRMGGKVFLYELEGKLIGYNICFVHNDCLVDKYVGFIYPDAREANLYFISWFQNLEYAIKHGLKTYIAGWTDPKVKASLGASFTMTRHAVFIANPILRAILKPLKSFFESDTHVLQENQKEK